ncbi:MAG: hypothetical protein ACFCU6_11460 [Balneolaceae bacterium]
MNILFGILAGITTTFLFACGLIVIGRAWEKVNEYWHWFPGGIAGLLFLATYCAVLAGLIGMIGSMFEDTQFFLKGLGLGIMLGWLLYIPFAKWRKLYK